MHGSNSAACCGTVRGSLHPRTKERGPPETCSALPRFPPSIRDSKRSVFALISSVTASASGAGGGRNCAAGAAGSSAWSCGALYAEATPTGDGAGSSARPGTGGAREAWGLERTAASSKSTCHDHETCPVIMEGGTRRVQLVRKEGRDVSS